VPRVNRVPSSAGDRVVGDHADAVAFAQREQLELVASVQQVVARLHGVEARGAEHLAAADGSGELPRREVGTAHVADLPLLDDVVERLEGFVDRCVRIG
jgi:hypothetical protein